MITKATYRAFLNILLCMIVWLTQLGCQTTNPALEETPTTTAQKLRATEPVFSPDRKRYETHVQWREQPPEVKIEAKMKKRPPYEIGFVDFLKKEGVTHVNIDTEEKLTLARVQQLVKLYHEAGIIVNEFWVPHGFPPRRVNFMKAY